MTLVDLKNEINQLKATFNELETKGLTNASLIVFGVRKCDALIKMIDLVIQTSEEKQGDPPGKDRDENEHDTDAAIEDSNRSIR